MGKKTDYADVKKECPSCGLGVALDARICEFCGWDFDEEDEWILQIEKLERDLVLEKQRFEPGTVGSKIESSLHTPVAVKKEQMRTSAAKAKLRQEMEEVLGSTEGHQEPPKTTVHAESTPIVREVRREEVLAVEARDEPPEAEPIEKTPAVVATAPVTPGKMRRIRKVKGAQTSEPAPTQPQRGRIIKKARE